MVSNLVICLIPAVLVLIVVRKLRERSWGYCKNNVTLNNKVAIITGANTGIGYEVAKELAARGAEVVLACRNVETTKKAIEKMVEQVKKPLNLRAMELDLSSLKSIQQFSFDVQELYPHVHLLINNAGVAYPKNQVHLTNENFEIHFGVNHIGHFYLTTLLLDTLKKSSSRVVIVSSSLHEKAKIDVDNLDVIPQPNTNLYASSKLANVYFCKELAKRTQGTGIKVYAVCPGWVYTQLFRHSIHWYHYILVAPIAFLFMRTPKQGSQSVIYCATDPALENQTGLLYRNCAPYASKVKFDDSISSKLWEESERLIDEKINK